MPPAPGGTGAFPLPPAPAGKGSAIPLPPAGGIPSAPIVAKP